MLLREGDGDLGDLLARALARRPELDVVVAVDQRRMLHPRTWRLLRSLRARAGRPIRVFCAHRLESPAAAVIGSFPLFQPLLSAVMVLQLPVYAYRQVWRQLVRSDERDVVGHGAGRGAGGLVYWLDYARRADRCGERGVAHDEYFGVPLSVHCWPLALTAIRRLGFRRLLGLSAALILLGAGLLPGPLAVAWALLLAVATLLSTWAMLSVHSGTWEPLAWGLATLALAAGVHGEPVVAGVLLGATAMTHPGVAALAAVSTTLAGGQALGLWGVVLTGAVALVTCSPFAVAYLRSGRFLGRGGALNVFERRWSLVSSYQLAGWLGFVAVALLTTDGRSPEHVVLLALPALALYVNTKLYWWFSQYTVISFMLFVGLQDVLLRPGWWSAIAFLLAANPVPRHLVLATPGLLRGFDLTPARITAVRERVGTSLRPSDGGATGFEVGTVTDEVSYATAALAYLLAEDGQPVFNSGYAEVGSSLLYESCTRFMAPGTDATSFRRATIDAGVTTFVAFTPAFARDLEAWGATPRTVLRGLRVSPRFGGPVTDVHVFDLPWSSSRWSRLPLVELAPNRVALRTMPDERLVLPLTAFAGWRARQDGEEVPIEVDPLGLAVATTGAGEVELRYRYRHYLRR